MPRTPAPGTRDRILDNAARLFYEHGVHEVGLQQIVDAACCGKNLLYREFESKDDLVVAWLERCADEWRDHVEDVEPDAEPAARLVAIVRDFAARAAAPGYRGCALRNTYAEFGDPDHPAHRVSVEYLRDVRSYLLDLATRAGATRPDALADRLMLIIDGLAVNSAMLGANGAGPAAVTFAEEVVAAAID